MEYSSIFNFCSVTSANLTKVYRMKEFFSSFFSSANIIERAKALIINAFALSGRTNDNTIIPRVSLRLPWAMRSLGFQPAPAKSGRSNDNTIIPRVSLRLPWAKEVFGLSARLVCFCYIPSQDLQMIILRSDSDAV